MAEQQLPEPSINVMRLRYAGTCACGIDLPAGTRAGYDRSARVVVCPDCLERRVETVPTIEPLVEGEMAAEETEPHVELKMPPDQIDPGAAGASLRREYERRKAAREERVRTNHKRLGGLILALSDEPATTRAFATGADGEERLAARLERDCMPDVLFLHNRRLGRSRRDGDIDHVAVTPSGVYVIDAKRYPNAKVRVQRSGGIFSPVREQLMVGGRDRTKLLAGCAKQVEAVRSAMAEYSGGDGVPVIPLLCFVDADLPLFSKMEIGGVRLLGPKGTIKVITSTGGLDAEARADLWRHLAKALPSA